MRSFASSGWQLTVVWRLRTTKNDRRTTSLHSQHPTGLSSWGTKDLTLGFRLTTYKSKSLKSNDWRTTINESCVRSFAGSGWQFIEKCHSQKTNNDKRTTKDERRTTTDESFVRSFASSGWQLTVVCHSQKTNNERRKTTDEKRPMNPVWDPSQAQDDSLQQCDAYEKRTTSNGQRTTSTQQKSLAINTKLLYLISDLNLNLNFGLNLNLNLGLNLNL